MIRKVISLLVAVVLLIGCFEPAFAEEQAAPAIRGAVGAALLEKAELPGEQPCLALYVEYAKGDQIYTTHAKATLLYVNSNGKSDNPAAQDIVIELKTEDTLELIAGSEYHVFYDELPCGGVYTFEFDLYCAPPTQQVDKAPEPKLTISVKSANVGSCEYVCTFDCMTEPRALVWGWETGNKAPRAIQNDIMMMTELFQKSYYNAQPFEVSSYYNHEDFWELMAQIQAMEIDENDVTYIYINAHGLTYNGTTIFPGFEAFAPDSSVTFMGNEIKNKNLVLYTDFLGNLQMMMKGRVVLVLDSCFSGSAIARAEAAGFEAGQLSLLTSVDEFSGSGVYDNWLTEDYGWFTKEVYDGFSAGTGAQTVGDVYGYMREYADTHVMLGNFATIDPQFTGNEDTLLFCFDPNILVDDPEFVVVEETLTIEVPVSPVIVTTESYVDAAEHFSCRIVRPHVYAAENPELTAIIDAELDKLYLEKMNSLEARKASAASCKSRTKDHTETLILTAAYSTGGLVTLSFQKGYYDCSIGHNVNETIVRRFDVATGKLLELPDFLDVENNPDAEADFIAQMGVQLKAAGASSSDAGKAYSEALKNRYARWDLSPRGIEFSIDRLNSGIGCGGFTVPYDQLTGILKDAYIPAQSTGQAEMSFSVYDAAAAEGRTVYENAPAVNMLTMEGKAGHVWVANNYITDEADGRCSYFYAYCAGDALITLPEPQYAEYGYTVIWIDGNGEHIESVKNGE